MQVTLQQQRFLGVSLGTVARLGDFNLKASFDQQNPIDQTTGYVLAKRAKQFGNASAEYRNNAVTAGVEGTCQANRNDYSNTGYIGGYGTFKTYASYNFAKDWSLFGRWNNMPNKSYQLSYGYVTPGSNVYLWVSDMQCSKAL